MLDTNTIDKVNISPTLSDNNLTCIHCPGQSDLSPDVEGFYGQTDWQHIDWHAVLKLQD